jgi:diguanylate cyclase (GGDEF)-like protein/PAS domain S-box-containing protein
MYQCTLSGKITGVNPAFAKIFGYENTTHLMNNVSYITTLYKNKSDRELFLSKLKENEVVTDYEMEMVDNDGNALWILINARLTKDQNGNSLIDGILINNTKRRKAEDKLVKSRERFRYLANHDSLTGLFNTRYLYKALDKLIIKSDKRCEPFSLVFLDMDDFKNVVDTYGHLNGSQALKEVAETLKKYLMEPSFGVAYGGDEFVLVLPKTNKKNAYTHVKKIRNLIKTTTYLTNKDLSVHMSASFGLATYPDDAVDTVGLLALADEAMFRVKTRGKDAVGISNEE